MTALDLPGAHRDVRRHRNGQGRGVHDPWLAAIECLQGDDPAVRREGAALLASLAGDDGLRAPIALFDLAAAADDPDPETRVRVVAVLATAALSLPRQAIRSLPALASRLEDPDPLVREAAASGVAWLANEFAVPDSGGRPETDDDPWADLAPSTRREFEAAVEPLLDLATTPAADRDAEARFDVPEPADVFRGPVDAGDDRSARSRQNAAFALATLGARYPDAIAESESGLVELAFDGRDAETRGYAVDALGRAGADDALRSVRDRSVAQLRERSGALNHDRSGAELGDRSGDDRPDHSGDRSGDDRPDHSGDRSGDDRPDHSGDPATADVARLECISLHRGGVLAPVRDLLRDLLDAGADDVRGLAATATLHAAAAGVDDLDEAVGRIVEAELVAEPDREYHLYGLGGNLLADVATALPEAVLDPLLAGLGVRDGTPQSDSAMDRPDEWNRSRGWELLLDVARESPGVLRSRIRVDRLARAEECSEPATARRVFAHVVEEPVDDSDVDRLLSELRAGDSGAEGALATLVERCPGPVFDRTMRACEGIEAPSGPLASHLATLAERDADRFRPLLDALANWHATLDRSDEAAQDVLAALARTVCAAGDEARARELLGRLATPGTLERLEEAGVLAPLVETFPNLAAPALLEHLSDGSASTKRRVLETLADVDVQRLDGWSGAVVEAARDRLDDDWRTRLAVVRFLAASDVEDRDELLEPVVDSTTSAVVRYEALRVLEGDASGD